jgi:uncharacterized membrane protein
MPLSTLTVIQTVVWVIAGSAVLRLWNSHDWIVWTLIPMLILEMGISATLKRVVQEGESEMIRSTEDRETFKRVWTAIHKGLCLAAAGLGIYGHTLA